MESSSSSSGGAASERRSGGGSWSSVDSVADPFDIPPKGAAVERLKNGGWVEFSNRRGGCLPVCVRIQQAALVLNASRSFRYTLDLKKEEQKEEVIRQIRAQAHVIRAAFRFKEAGLVHIQPKELTVPQVDGALGFGIKEQLTALTRDHNYSALQQYGGIS
ncbi:hypothetical protein GUJ93_ZPchr0458g22478 [Zizania palustris]|uniref:Calcium-transporting P-type ATPase N-terminal autoinhibitory domain-containing protein n=1 Tax=Zizania palustris TaxID=103762 RepID=A0A8J5VDQ5_ZIZPA|nr:hypothetical protein GUJ93_ZPchr0458g22478 [Zizania palustris]